MIHKVESFISRHKLLTPGAKVLVALSGGADSVALLVALLSWATVAKLYIATFTCAEQRATATRPM